MTDIHVTSAAVRKLAESLSTTDTTSLRHTDRLALIASAFGWKADAFMHALKKKPRDIPTTPGALAPPFSVLSAGRNMAPSAATLFDRVGEELSRNPGIYVAGGLIGTGRTTVLEHVASRVIASGRCRSVVEVGERYARGLGFWEVAVPDDAVCLLPEIRKAGDARLAVEIARRGNVVITSALTTALARARSMVTRLFSEAGCASETRLVRAVTNQQLFRKTCNACGAAGGDGCVECGGSGYRGRVLVAEGEILPANWDGAPPVSGTGQVDSMTEVALAAVAEGLTDLREVERLMGFESLRRCGVKVAPS